MAYCPCQGHNANCYRCFGRGEAYSGRKAVNSVKERGKGHKGWKSPPIPQGPKSPLAISKHPHETIRSDIVDGARVIRADNRKTAYDLLVERLEKVGLIKKVGLTVVKASNLSPKQAHNNKKVSTTKR